MRRAIAALAVVLTVAAAAACVEEVDENPLAAGSGSGSEEGSGGWLGEREDAEEEVEDDLEEPIAPETGLDEQGDAPDVDTIVKAALLDVEAFWDRSYESAYGTPYEPISGGFWAYGPDTDLPPCGFEPFSYSDIAANAFYCPSDESIYIDTAFFGTLSRNYGASEGPLAQMYVLAHEWGHHISNLTGSLQQVGRETGASSGSVRLELQADCYAGAWVRDASSTTDSAGVPLMKPVTQSEITDALSAAAAVGDDHIQDLSGQRVNPDGFTHGTSEQRQRWFLVGYQTGPTACDTFSVSASEL